MISPVTKRFIDCHKLLLASKKVKSSRQFALLVDILPQNLNEILKGRREVTIDLIRKSIELFNFNPLFLFTGQSEPFIEDKDYKIRELIVVKKSSAPREMLYIPVDLQQDYAKQALTEQTLMNLNGISLPDTNLDPKQHRGFEVRGDFMEPIFYEGEKVIARFVEPVLWLKGVKDNLIYVIVTNEDVFLCKVINQMSAAKSFKFYNENKNYKPWIVPVYDIREIWQVQKKISPYISTPKDPNEMFRKELEALQQSNKFLINCIRDIQKNIKSD